MGRATGLDLVRVGAAFSVFLFHGRVLAGVALGGPLAAYGYLAVPVFFALSGYLVYRPFTLGQIEPIDFLLRRAARLLPAVAFALAGMVFLSPDGFLWLLVVLWSLIVEAMFYASLPLFARLAGRHELLVVAVLTIPSVAFSQALGAASLGLPRLLFPYAHPRTGVVVGLRTGHGPSPGRTRPTRLAATASPCRRGCVDPGHRDGAFGPLARRRCRRHARGADRPGRSRDHGSVGRLASDGRRLLRGRGRGGLVPVLPVACTGARGHSRH